MKSASLAPLLIATVLSACGGVNIKPEAVLPKPLIVQIPADVGLIIPPETRKYVDKETRFGVDWKVDLGPGEVRLMQDIFKHLFQHVEEFKDLEAARAAKDLKDIKALFETRVDQYSFVTARETGGRYYAVTIDIASTSTRPKVRRSTVTRSPDTAIRSPWACQERSR